MSFACICCFFCRCYELVSLFTGKSAIQWAIIETYYCFQLLTTGSYEIQNSHFQKISKRPLFLHSMWIFESFFSLSHYRFSLFLLSSHIASFVDYMTLKLPQVYQKFYQIYILTNIRHFEQKKTYSDWQADKINRQYKEWLLNLLSEVIRLISEVQKKRVTIKKSQLSVYWEQWGSVMCVCTWCSDPAHLHFSLKCLPNEEEIKKLTYQHIVQQTTKRMKQSTLEGLRDLLLP